MEYFVFETEQEAIEAVAAVNIASMKYLVFETEQEAIEAVAAVNLALGYPKKGINAATGLPDESVITERWAIPQQIQDGRWVFQSPDNNGVEAEEDWWPVNNINL